MSGHSPRETSSLFAGLKPDEIILDTVCIKRDGTRVPFDVSKIRSAVSRCFQQVSIAETMLEPVVRGAVASVVSHGKKEVSVEDIQRFVIAQLWAHELFEAAEHYQNYREERRKARSQKPVDAKTRELFDGMSSHFSTDLQIYQYLSKFSRWRDDCGRRETWHEAVFDRVIPWFQRVVQNKAGSAAFSRIPWAELGQAMYNLQALPAMRVLQLAGPALDRCHVGVFNCAYTPINKLSKFAEFLYVLMQGTGCGFSVEKRYISALPTIRPLSGKTRQIVVEDNTESWCDALHETLLASYRGDTVTYDMSRVRPKGARLLTKGGRASGPEPLRELLQFVQNVINANRGRKLADTDVHRICCFIGRIVQVGGVRRAATISLSDLDSVGMRRIKTGSWYDDKTYWDNGRYLTMANNSAVYEAKPSSEMFLQEWLSLVESKSGERGIFSRYGAARFAPARRKWGGSAYGVNPCAEIILNPNQFCNLSIAVARAQDCDPKSLFDKVAFATIFGAIQSLCTDFRYLSSDWKIACEEERLLGVDITGHADCPLLRWGTPGRDKLLVQLREHAVHVAKVYSELFGINMPAAVTTVKPSGDSAVFLDCASGVSPRFSKYQIRWVRQDINSPMASFLIDQGVPYALAPEDPKLLVFGFPKQAPDGSTLVSDMTAVEQLENWLEWKTNYAEHSVSATVYVDDSEWVEAGSWVYKNFDKLTGVSFNPRDNGIYRYAPNESLTKEQYDEFCSKFPSINWAKLTHYEDTDMTTSAQTFACTSGACEI